MTARSRTPEYQRQWRARRFAIPEYAARERIRTREKVRRMRADPAYQQWAAARKDAVDHIKAEIGCARCADAHWSSAALVFHHIDPATKRFVIAGNNRLQVDLRAEAAKCIVLCGGCHMEMHELLRIDSRAYWREVLQLEQDQRHEIDEKIAALMGER
jgi:hypothetical protein